MPSRLPAELRESLYEVLEYLWLDEQKDWEAHGFPTKGHIFNDLRRIESWLAKNARPHEA